MNDLPFTDPPIADDTVPYDADELCQYVADTTALVNVTAWGRYLKAAAVAVLIDEAYTGPRVDPVTGERITTMCARVAYHWSGRRERYVQVAGRAALAGLADLIEPDTPVGVLDWCLKLGADNVRGRDARRWFRIARRLRLSLRELKEAAGVVASKPAPSPEIIAVMCPECHAEFEATIL